VPDDQSPGPQKAEEARGKHRNGENPFVAVLLPVLTVIGTGIGAIGFVIFFGGFIVWARFNAAGLPANEAVARVPRSDLVATGASFLVPALLAALGAVALAVAGWDLAIGSRRRAQAREADEDRLGATRLIAGLEAELSQTKREIVRLHAKVEELKEAADQAKPQSPERASAQLERDETEIELRKYEACTHQLEGVDMPAARRAQLNAAVRKAEVKDQNRVEQAWQVVLGAIPMVIAGGIVIVLGLGGMTFWYGVLAIGVAVATVAMAIVVASMTRHFAWYTLCVFLGVGITIAAATFARTQSNVKVSPVAALTGAAPVTGFYVAETSDSIYFGVPEIPQRDADGDELTFDHGAATLVRVPKASVSGFTVGPLMGEDDAYRRSIELALALCRHAKVAAGEVDEGSASNSATLASAKSPRPCMKGSEPRLERRLAAAKAPS
jgi:hypothetical protein